MGGKTVCIFLKVLPFFFSNKIPTRLIQISVIFKKFSNLFSSKYYSTISIIPAFAWVFILYLFDEYFLLQQLLIVVLC